MWRHGIHELINIPDKAIGFVYCITNMTNGKRYIGKKNFYFIKHRKVKGKQKKVKIESDWKDYWSSSEELLKEIEKTGKEHFTRNIIYICYNKMQLNYLELREQIDRRVIENDDYYNNLIYVRIRKIGNLCPTPIKTDLAPEEEKLVRLKDEPDKVDANLKKQVDNG
jgi:hypothetical protein